MANFIKVKSGAEFHVACARTSLGWAACIRTHEKQKTIQIHGDGLSESLQKVELAAAVGNAILEMWGI